MTICRENDQERVIVEVKLAIPAKSIIIPL